MAEEFTAKFKVDISDLKRNITDANKQIKMANAEFEAASAGMDDWSKSADGVDKKMEQLKKVLQAQLTTLKSYKDQLQAQKDAYDENGRRAEQLRAKLQELADKGVSKTSEEYKKYESALKEVVKEQDKNAKAADDLQISVLKEEAAIGKTEKEMRKYSDTAEDAGKASGKAGELIKQAATAITAAAAAIGAAAVAAGKKLWDMAQETANAGDEIDKTSQKLGMSAKAYQEWDYVLGQSGVEITSMTTGLKTLTNQIDDAKNGSEKAAARFEALGISLEDLNTMSREDIFAKVVEGFQGMADSTERAALANDLFGKSGQELTPLFNTSIEATNELKQAANDLGLVMSDEAVKAATEFNDSLDTMKRAASGAKNRLVGDLLPGIAELTTGFTELIAGGDGAGDTIKKGVSSIISSLTSMLPKATSFITSMATAVLQAAPSIISSLMQGIMSALPQLAPVAIQVITQFVSTILSPENIVMLVNTAISLIQTLANGIAEALPELIPSAITAILTFVSTLLEPENIDKLIDAALNIIKALADGIVNALPTIAKVVPEIIIKLVKTLTNGENLQKVIGAALEVIKSLAQGLIAALPELAKQIPTLVSSLVQFLLDPNNIVMLLKAAAQIIVALGDGLIKAIPELLKSVGEILNGIMRGLRDGFSKIFTIGKELIEGLWNGMKDKATWLWNKVKELCGGVVDKIKNFFGIHSPSKVFAGIGENLGLGLGLGFVDAMKEIAPKMIKAVPTDFDMKGAFGSTASAFRTSGAQRVAATAAAGSTSTTFNQYINAPKAPSRIELYRDGKNLLSLKTGGSNVAAHAY